MPASCGRNRRAATSHREGAKSAVSSVTNTGVTYGCASRVVMSVAVIPVRTNTPLSTSARRVIPSCDPSSLGKLALVLRRYSDRLRSRPRLFVLGHTRTGGSSRRSALTTVAARTASTFSVSSAASGPMMAVFCAYAPSATPPARTRQRSAGAEPEQGRTVALVGLPTHQIRPALKIP